MAFGQDFLQGFVGGRSLKDYSHASKTFRSNGYELAPRNKFLFHVYFNINTSQIRPLQAVFDQSDQSAIGLLVKTIQLPSFSIDTETLNQYNRKRVVQKKINYLPVRVEFHDDAGDIVRNMWYNYFSYYYKDPNQQYGSTPAQNGTNGPSSTQPGFSYLNRDIYLNDRPVNDWGFIGESYDQAIDGITGQVTGGKPMFFRDITIYGLNQHKFAQYTLINPVIKEWQHDTYDYSAGSGTMSNTMSIEYETVKYFAGAIGESRPDTNVKGFADPARYDQVKSSLARPGSTASVLGKGGLLDAGVGIIEDLQSGGVAGFVGAIQKAATVNQTFKGKDLKSIVKEEAVGAFKDVLRNTQPGAIKQLAGGAAGMVFPKPPVSDPAAGTPGINPAPATPVTATPTPEPPPPTVTT
jgi:hypothetical protein